MDRADDEFEAFLLEVLSDFQITVPELGTFRALLPPFVILTSNRTRDVHDALEASLPLPLGGAPRASSERWPSSASGSPASQETLARQVAAAVEAMRALQLYKPPGVAETIDWASALGVLGTTELSEATVNATLGTVLKYREDQERVRQHGVADLVKQAFERGMQTS